MTFEDYCDKCFETRKDGCFSMSKTMCRNHYEFNKKEIDSLKAQIKEKDEQIFVLKEELINANAKQR